MLKYLEKNQSLTEFVVDIGRPDIYDENSRNFWLDFNNYIHTCDYPIYANNMFFYIEEKIQDPEWSYIGGGYKYFFWFDSEDDRKTFSTKWGINHE
jgi:hypothetical protein